MSTTLELELREINEALLISSVHQHELTEVAEKAEAALRASNDRFESLFDASPVGMYLVDADLRIRLASREARRVFGDIRGLIGSNFIEVIHVLWRCACADDVVARFRHTLATGEQYIARGFSEERCDLRVREYYDWQIQRIAQPDGRFGVVCYFSDTSARVLAEQAMRDSEIRYRRLFESSQDGILILDFASGKVADANPFMTQLLGYTHEELLGKELWEIGLFADQQASRAAYQELQANGYIHYDHLPLETNHGERREVEFVSSIYQVESQPIAQCNIRNIDERVRLERKTHEQAATLADLHRRKDEFLAMLSHELRNPLAPISNAVQLLRLQQNETPVQQQAHEVIERQVGQMTRLIDDLLEVSRITTGRIHLHKEQVTINGVVQNAVGTVRAQIEQRRHTFELSLSPAPVFVHADAARLEQVIVNLLVNASKYMDEGGKIWLSVSQEGEEAIIRVRDTGVGIAPDLLPRIFDLFTQADRSLDRSQGGLGIGLCLVQRLVEMHQGSVEVHSTLGEGSEFVVRLPAMKGVAALEPPATEKLRPITPTLRVLVVDDNVDAAKMLGMLLHVSGHDVRMAYDGPPAIEAALAYRPHVVLLDIGLPGMNGFEVAQRIRKLPELDGVVLVALTGYGQTADRQRSLKAGFDHHLIKPADFAQVKEILASVKAM